jgi:hypothetical protein
MERHAYVYAYFVVEITVASQIGTSTELWISSSLVQVWLSII